MILSLIEEFKDSPHQDEFIDRIRCVINIAGNDEFAGR